MYRPSAPRVVAASVLSVGLLLTPFPVARAQSAADAHTSGTDLQWHKFTPKIAPESASNGAVDNTVSADGIGRFAASQMAALQREKDTRTPAQQKVDSNLLYTERMLQGRDAAPGVPALYTGATVDENNNLVVDMIATVSDTLLKQLAASGVTVVSTNAEYRSIRAIIPPDKIEQIAALPDVLFISPLQESSGGVVHVAPAAAAAYPYVEAPEFASKIARVREMLEQYKMPRPENDPGTPVYGQGGQGSVETEGDYTHQTVQARSIYGLTGAGLKIGVLSDGVNSAAASQSTADLPPTCGTGVASPCLTVLSGQAGNGDEGTAMLEIIHDMVPGANLYFATASSGIAQFAANIQSLQAAGCNIIVDDWTYFAETPFQNGQAASVVSNTNGGIVIQAVANVAAQGVFYFSDAGNQNAYDSGNAGTYEGDFNPQAATSPLTTTGFVHNFGSGLSYDPISIRSATGYYLFWSDPLGGSANDYDLYILDTTGTTVISSSTNVQSGTQDPYEYIGSNGSIVANTRLVVYKKAGAANRFFHVTAYRGSLAIGTSGEVQGHNAAAAGYSVAATPAYTPDGSFAPNGPYPNPFSTSSSIEPYSSDGLRHIFYNADSSPITPGDVSSTGGSFLNKPDITAADGVSITGAGGFENPFYGTSAAAPAAGSIAALLLAAKPTLTQAQMKTALTSTALDILATGYDRDSGSGIIMALPALKSLGVSGNANPELGSIVAAENPGNGDGYIMAGEGAALTVGLKNTTGVLAATGITATLTTTTPGVIIRQPATSTYADMAAGAGAENGATPFAFTLSNSYACGQVIQFTLNVTYSGGQARSLPFTVSPGSVSITNTLGSTPVLPTGITFSTGTAKGRFTRTGVASSCGTTKTNPGAANATVRTYDSYSFQSCSTTCFQSQITALPAGVNLLQSFYTPSFNPNNIPTNYAGDSGTSSITQTVGVQITSSNNYTVVVEDINGNPPSSGVPNTYTVSFPACAYTCAANYPLPLAFVRNVTVTAATVGGTANANIDNGSNDPNGGPVTITQTPAAPYPVGTTTVILTVTNKNGAFAQATATVTVQSPSTVSWAPPATTGYNGVALGGLLNAMGSVPGAISYSTVINGVTTALTATSTLAPGVYIIVATLTPTDQNYASSTTSITYTVVNQELFVANSGGTVVSKFDDGSRQSDPVAGGGIGAAIDANGFVWSITADGLSVSKFTDTGSFVQTYAASSVKGGKALAIDGDGMVWILNTSSPAGSVSVLTNAGVQVSSTPYAQAGGLTNPRSISVDTAGSLWIANGGNGTVTEVIGVAAPVQTPTVSQVLSSTPGTRP